MKRILLLATLATAAMTSAHAGPNVGVTIDIQQPGIYGRVTVGNVLPAVVLPQPVIIAPSRVAVVQQPVYLYVPVAHQTQWGRHCAAYAACGQPVYFVQESWAREHGHHGRHGHDHAHDRGHGKGHGHGHHKNKHKKKHERHDH